MERLICLAIGYVFGLFQTGYIYGRLNKVDIRDYGSGNAGATNTMRVLGKKAGIITYFGDALKAVFCIILVWIMYGKKLPDMVSLLSLYAGLGVILGHNFPFYLKFKGGKGIATTSGVIFSFDWKLTILGFITFFGTMYLSKYVSLASLVFVTGFFIELVIFGNLSMLNIHGPYLYEAYALGFIIMALAYIRHRANIKRLLTGTERKIGQKKESK